MSRNLDAEVRAVEEGHRALLDREDERMARSSWKVVSDTKHDKHYRVSLLVPPWVAGEPLSFRCEPEGAGSYADDHRLAFSPEPGQVPCKHAALVARRLEREGYASFDGAWRATDTLAYPPDPDEDPFEGL